MKSSAHEITVFGGGAAGLACALAAARLGAGVLLLEITGRCGGTVGEALIHTIGGLFDDQGRFLNNGLPVELTERLSRACEWTRKRRIGKTWVLNVDPEVYVKVISDWIAMTPNITVGYLTKVGDITINNGSVREIEIYLNSDKYTISPAAVVDTTGSANVIRQIDVNLVSQGEAMGGFIVSLRGLAPDVLQFPKGIGVLREIRSAVGRGELPLECGTTWLDAGVYPGEAYAKFSIADDEFDYARMMQVADSLRVWMRSLPGFEDAYIHRYGKAGIRDAGRAKGQYCLTENDIIEGKRFDDTACLAAWPIEHWNSRQGISLEYFPPGHYYTIPMRCLQVTGYDNLWVAGKCLSAEPRAQASARVAGTCWAMGESVGRYIAGTL